MNIRREISAFEIFTKQKNQGQSTFYTQKEENLKKTFKTSKYVKKLKLENKKKIGCKTKLSNNYKVLGKLNSKNFQDVHKKKFNNKSTKKCFYYKKKGLLTKTEDKFFFKHEVDQLNQTNLQEKNFNPLNESTNLFEWLIYPVKQKEFFIRNWEKTPLHIKRHKPKFYKNIISTPILDEILRKNHILYTKNLDITSFVNNKRETHNPTGRALPNVVWDYFSNGCSVRLLNPQTYIPNLHNLNATLQEFFGCFVGANSYLTPPNSQGFAPHFDDIEAFVLQIEGKKRWRLYKPRSNNEFLPRYSSLNFSQDEIGKPILDTIVNPGDLLYFPRGIIHQGDTVGFEQHSLHITISVYQKNSWGDLLEKLLPEALQSAIEHDVRFRKGLPLDYLKYVGTANPGTRFTSIRGQFLKKIKSLLNVLSMKYINIDKAADEMAKNHIHDFLPPFLNKYERICSVYDGGRKIVENGMIINPVEIGPDSFIRLSRAHCVRLIEENNMYRLYYSCDNSREYHEYEPQFLEVEKEYVPLIEEIILQYPKYIKVENLPLNELNIKLQIVQDLWEKAIVVSKDPLPII